MAIYEQKNGIKQWAEADRPREKLLLNGRRHITDAELIAILIGSGNKDETAVELAKRILASCNNDIEVLGRLSVKDLAKFRGIGDAKAISIVAAIELGRRRKGTEDKTISRIMSSSDSYGHLLPIMADLNHEEFWIIALNRANHVLGKFQISKGGFSGTVADPKVIFRTALDHNASSIILAHNHPSGNLNPSQQDINITQKIVSAGFLIEVTVLDHLIVTNKSFYSFSDAGLI